MYGQGQEGCGDLPRGNLWGHVEKEHGVACSYSDGDEEGENTKKTEAKTRERKSGARRAGEGKGSNDETCYGQRRRYRETSEMARVRIRNAEAKGR